MYKALQPLILASGSPRRREFFNDLGLNYTVQVAEIVEKVQQGESPESFVSRMAQEKAAAVCSHNKESWVVAADTIVCLNNTILGKPKDSEDAVKMLCSLSGREHTVLTSFCLMNDLHQFVETQTVATKVLFTAFSVEVARAYVATGEPLDKAGSYGIQGVGGCLVERIDGSASNVIGLPLAELVECLQKNSIISC